MSTRTEVQLGETRSPDAGPTRFVNAARSNTAFTAGFEKRVLIWIAQRTPAGINSDHLTALAFLSQLCAGAAYALASQNARAFWLVNFFLALNWLGDSLDGTLARVRNRQRPRYGFYVDHILDTFGALALLAGLGCSGYLHWQVAAGMLVCFYTLSIESYLATYAIGCFHLSHGIFGPTEFAFCSPPEISTRSCILMCISPAGPFSCSMLQARSPRPEWHSWPLLPPCATG